jgi:hypothetical protein
MGDNAMSSMMTTRTGICFYNDDDDNNSTERIEWVNGCFSGTTEEPKIVLWSKEKKLYAFPALVPYESSSSSTHDRKTDMHNNDNNKSGSNHMNLTIEMNQRPTKTTKKKKKHKMMMMAKTNAGEHGNDVDSHEDDDIIHAFFFRKSRKALPTITTTTRSKSSTIANATCGSPGRSPSVHSPRRSDRNIDPPPLNDDKPPDSSVLPLVAVSLPEPFCAFPDCPCCVAPFQSSSLGMHTCIYV